MRHALLPFAFLAVLSTAAPAPGVPPVSGLSYGALAVLPLVLLGIGGAAAVISFIAWQRRPRATDEEILARLGTLSEETPSAAPPATSPPS